MAASLSSVLVKVVNVQWPELAEKGWGGGGVWGWWRGWINQSRIFDTVVVVVADKLTTRRWGSYWFFFTEFHVGEWTIDATTKNGKKNEHIGNLTLTILT